MVRRPLVSRRELEAGFVELSFRDGQAEMYGARDPSSGFMLTHVGGESAWDFLVNVASACGLTIMLAGLVVVTDAQALRDLPEELLQDARVATSGATLRMLLKDA